MPEKNPKVKLGLKNLAMFPNYFVYIFVHLRQKACVRPNLSPKYSSSLGPNRKARPHLQLCPGPLNLIFANQFKCITRVRLRFSF